MYPDKSPGTQGQWAGSISVFRVDMRPGHTVITNQPHKGLYAVGIISGDYQYDPLAFTYPNRRSVGWIVDSIPRDVLSQQAKYKLRARQTVFRVNEEVRSEILRHVIGMAQDEN